MAQGLQTRVKNGSNRSIPQGRAVSIIGFDNSNFIPIIALSSYDVSESIPSLGLTLSEINSGDIGLVKTSGIALGPDTSMANIGQNVYIGLNGNLLYSTPNISNNKKSQQIGVVLTSEEIGQIFLLPMELVQSSDHKNLLNLSSDDHHQYILTNGARSFSGVISGIDPTSAAHLATKNYIDTAVSRKYGEIYISSPSSTAVATAGTYVKVAGTTATAEMADFSMPTSNRLTYNGERDIVATIQASLSFHLLGGQNNRIISFRFASSGITLIKTQIDRFVATPTDVGAISISGLCSFSNGDYLEVYVTSETNLTDVTVDLMNMSAYVIG